MIRNKSESQHDETQPMKNYLCAPKLNYTANIPAENNTNLLEAQSGNVYEMPTDLQGLEMEDECFYTSGSSSLKRMRTDADADGHWQRDKVPKNKTKNNNPPDGGNLSGSYNVPISNKFTVLSETETEEQNTETLLESRIPKPEPIFVTGVVNILEFKKVMNNIIVSNKYTLTTMRSGHLVKLLPTDIESYKTIREQLLKQNISHYTYQLKHERAYRVVLRGMHHTEDVTLIKDELRLLGHEVRNISNVLHRDTKHPLPLFFIDLEPAPNNKTIFDVKHLNNTIVTFETPYKKREIVQCKRCQRFGHTKNHCNRPFRCVKCGNEHPTSNCSKIPDTPAVCVNCNENHPASYRGCKTYQDYKQKVYEPLREKRVVTQPTTQVVNPLQNPLPSTSGKSYAEVLKQSPIGNEKESINMLSTMEQMLSRFERTMEKLMDKMMDRMFDLIKTLTSGKHNG